MNKELIEHFGWCFQRAKSKHNYSIDNCLTAFEEIWKLMKKRQEKYNFKVDQSEKDYLRSMFHDWFYPKTNLAKKSDSPEKYMLKVKLL